MIDLSEHALNWSAPETMLTELISWFWRCCQVHIVCVAYTTDFLHKCPHFCSIQDVYFKAEAKYSQCLTILFSSIWNNDDFYPRKYISNISFSNSNEAKKCNENIQKSVLGNWRNYLICLIRQSKFRQNEPFNWQGLVGTCSVH